MDQIKEITYSFPIPAGYNRKYTIDLLIKLKSASEAVSISSILQEILQRLKNGGKETALKQRMFHEYRSERKTSPRLQLSNKRLDIIANYFGIQIEELITN